MLSMLGKSSIRLPGLDSLPWDRCPQGRVLVRVDFNLPVDSSGIIRDATRVERLRTCIEDLRSRKARIVLLSHRGRPKGRARRDLSLLPLRPQIAGILGCPLSTSSACVGEEPREIIATLAPGSAVLLENLRFHVGEDACDVEFAKELARLGDLYVNDAFSVSHRAAASTVLLPELLPAAAGPGLRDELSHLSRIVENPLRPLAVVVGGAKISDKLPLLESLLPKTDIFLIGGGMANTFVAAQGAQMGRSLQEPDLYPQALRFLSQAREQHSRVLLPRDFVVASGLHASDTTTKTPPLEPEEMAFDIGMQSASAFAEQLKECRSLAWNGPLGCFEQPRFAKGTQIVAQSACAQTRSGKLFSVAGGGDSLAALRAAHATFSHVSVGGGAFLESLGGNVLPGVRVLAERT